MLSKLGALAVQIRRFAASGPSPLLPQFRLIESRFFAHDLCHMTDLPRSQLPVLVRKPDSVLAKFWWSETPFEKNARLVLPVQKLEGAVDTALQKVIELEPLIFNQPIRRDVVHRVLHWSLLHGMRTTHRTRTVAEVAGSGAKPRPQKGLGKARLGNKRASGRRKGGKIFGHIPKDFTYTIPHKLKIRGLVSVLSGKLAEGKVRVYESEALSEAKTGHLARLLPKTGHKEIYLFVVPKVADANFLLASRSLAKVKVVRPNEVCVRDLLKFDKVIFTPQSLTEMSKLLLGWLFQLEKPKAIRNQAVEELLNLNFSKSQPDAETPVFDPASGWEPKFQILKDYYKQYRKRTDAKEPPAGEGKV